MGKGRREAEKILLKIAKIAQALSQKQKRLLDPLFEFLIGFRPLLNGGQPLSTRTVAPLLGYVLARLPPEIFQPYPQELIIQLSNDSLLFAQPQNRDQLKTAPRRRRWYLSQKGLVILHLRGRQLLNSDLIEIISFLGVLNLLKQASWPEVASALKETNLSLAQKEAFQAWRKRKIKIELDWQENRPDAISVLLTQLKQTPARNLTSSRVKPLLLIGNDFSWRLMMFTLLISPSQVKQLEKIFAPEKKKIWEKIELINADWQNFAYKYILLTLLNKTYSSSKNNPPLIEALYQQIFNQTSFIAVGYHRLLYGKRPPFQKTSFQRSVLGEPVDYWQPHLFRPELLEDEVGSVKNFFLRLLKNNHSLISAPYVIGQVSAELTKGLIEAQLVNPGTIAFVGKVGALRDIQINHQLKRGDLIWPRKVYNLANHQVFDFPFGKNLFFNISSADFLTVPAITLQGVLDCETILKQQKDNFPLILEMEQSHLLGLNRRLRILPGFYVSDLSYLNQNQKQTSILQPLDPIEGGLAVWQAMLLVLQQLD